MSEAAPSRSNLDLVNEADGFAIPQRDPEGWLAARKLYYSLHVAGIVQYSIQLTVYTYVAGSKLPSIWIPKRSATTVNYSGMLDNTMAGGYRTGEDPLQTVIREAEEEASIPADLVRTAARPCGTISYFHHLDKYVIGEKFLVQPEVEYMYEMEAPAGLIPTPHDDEVEWFQLWDTD